MRTSTGLLAILVVALLAVASVQSPVRASGWQEAQVAPRPSVWQAFVDGSTLETSQWQAGSSAQPQVFPDPIGLLQAWLFSPMETLGVSFW